MLNYKAFLYCLAIVLLSVPVLAQDAPLHFENDPEIIAATQKIGQNPKDPKNYDMRSDRYFKLGDKIDALEDMKKALELEPDDDQKALRAMAIEQFMMKR